MTEQQAPHEWGCIYALHRRPCLLPPLRREHNVTFCNAGSSSRSRVAQKILNNFACNQPSQRYFLYADLYMLARTAFVTLCGFGSAVAMPLSYAFLATAHATYGSIHMPPCAHMPSTCHT